MVSIAILPRLQKRNTIYIFLASFVCSVQLLSDSLLPLVLAIVTKCFAAMEKATLISSCQAQLHQFHISYFSANKSIYKKNQTNITRHRSKLIHGLVESVRVMKPSVSLIFQSLFLNGNMLGQFSRDSVQIPLHSIKRLRVFNGRKSLEQN